MQGTPQTEAKRIAVIEGHPDPATGHFCHALSEAYIRGAHAAGHETRMIRIATMNFPFLRGRADQFAPPPQQIQEAQTVVAWADPLVMLYPIWNGGAPALLRGFLEQTFRPDFVFADAAKDKPLGFLSALVQKKRLKGKTGRIVATMQMPAFVYRWYFHPHTERNTLRLSGFSPVWESLIGTVQTALSSRSVT
jgi:putative NADPH-quinone reductase